MPDWMSLDDAPTKDILAYGYPLEPYSLEREMLCVEIVYRRPNGEWVIQDGTLFEPLGWIPIPEFEHPDKDKLPYQKFATGSPEFRVGDRVNYISRYDGMVVRTIISVINWPSGWWYELDEVHYTGHGNPSVGHKCLQWCDGRVCGRPAHESELLEIKDD